MKRYPLLIAFLLLLLILFVPVPRGTYGDGGTREYTALTYKIVDWHRLSDDSVYDPCKLYLFPKNLLSIDKLWELEDADIPTPDRSPIAGKIPFQAQYIRTDSCHQGTHYPVVRLIRSKAELKDYYEANKTLYDLERRESPASDSTIGFADACDRYDEAFFETKSLVLILLEENSGSNRHEVLAVRRNTAGKLTVDITVLTPEAGTCDMAHWHLFLEVATPIRNEADISLSFLDFMIPTDATATTATFRDRFTNITLPVPNNWQYTLTDRGIRFWPRGESKGTLYACFSDAFGVCGTGLAYKDIVLGGYEAEQGTYDNHDVWNYIYLKNTAGDYVIFNEGAAAWWDDYGEEAMSMLAHIVVAQGILPEEKAIDLAKRECTITYSDIRTQFDSQKGTWRVSFGPKDACLVDGDQIVTLDAVSGAVLDSVYSE